MIKNYTLSPAEEVRYQDFLSGEKVKLARSMSVLCSLLFLSFIVVDIWALPSAFLTAVTIRSLVIFSLLLIFLSTYYQVFNKYYSLIISSGFIAATLGIQGMMFIAVPSDQAYQAYFVGVILVLITLFSWTYLKLRIAIPLAILSVIGYVYIEVIHREMTISSYFPSFLANLFFLVSAGLIGFIAQMTRDTYLRQTFLLQEKSQKSLKEKTIEANDYAYKANHDALTLLPNRRYITELLEESLQVAKEKGKILAILFFDLNGFKQLNDIFGHAVGDEVLIIVAKRLELAIRKGDHIARLGGDEYLVGLMMDRDNASEVNTMAAKFTAIISKPMNIDGNIINVGAAVGIAAYPMHGNKVSVLIDIADKKMYNIKQGLQKLAKEREIKELAPVTIFPGNSKSRR